MYYIIPCEPQYVFVYIVDIVRKVNDRCRPWRKFIELPFIDLAFLCTYRNIYTTHLYHRQHRAILQLYNVNHINSFSVLYVWQLCPYNSHRFVRSFVRLYRITINPLAFRTTINTHYHHIAQHSMLIVIIISIECGSILPRFNLGGVEGSVVNVRSKLEIFFIANFWQFIMFQGIIVLRLMLFVCLFVKASEDDVKPTVTDTGVR